MENRKAELNDEVLNKVTGGSFKNEDEERINALRDQLLDKYQDATTQALIWYFYNTAKNDSTKEHSYA